MASIIVALLLAVVGLLAFALASNPKAAEAGKIAYAVGLFWTVAWVGKEVLRLP